MADDIGYRCHDGRLGLWAAGCARHADTNPIAAHGNSHVHKHPNSHCDSDGLPHPDCYALTDGYAHTNPYT